MKEYTITINVDVRSTLDAETLRRHIVVALIDPSLPLGETNPTYLDGQTEMLEVVDYHDTTVTEVCLHCDNTTLEYQVFDIDGHRLEEYSVCTKCGYGKPALR